MSRTLRIALFLLAAAASLHAKSLYWKSLDVQARLDARGDLDVTERHSLVFDGDWNGGERTFRIPFGQHLVFGSMSRIDDTSGRRVVLTPGDLKNVDHYDWTSGETLRWRSRLPSDPPFTNQTIVYELQYVMRNVLVPERGGVRLDHAFAFPERQGVIEHFTLHLELDPAFRPMIATPLHWEVANIAPGETFGVRIPLRYAGGTTPPPLRGGASPAPRAVIILLMVAACAALLGAFHRREKERGSFETPPDAVIDDAWLQAHVFTMPPEVAGAAWDSTTGGAEVAGLLARLIQEKKIASTITREGTLFTHDVLHLQLLVDRNAFSDYEKQLVNAFFFHGRTSVSSDELRAQYKTTGFDPASKIRAGVEKKVSRLDDDQRDVRRRLNAPLVLKTIVAAMLVVAVALLVAASMIDRNDAVAAAFVVSFGFLCFIPTLLLCLRLAKIASKSLAAVIAALLPLFAFGAVVAALAAGVFERGAALGVLPLFTFYHPGAFLLAGLALLVAASLSIVLSNAMSDDSPSRLAVRRNLIAARDFFRRQLKLRTPQLRDEWYPYLLAFGLGADADKWFRVYGTAAVSVAGTRTGAFSGGGASGADRSGPSGSWTGGGSSFGGAGAGGAWAAAAGSVAAGYSTASSSSGGGGGGGGFSSGGGGGGGW